MVIRQLLYVLVLQPAAVDLALNVFQVRSVCFWAHQRKSLRTHKKKRTESRDVVCLGI